MLVAGRYKLYPELDFFRLSYFDKYVELMFFNSTYFALAIRRA
jgi:hypothetical protein